MQLQLLGATSFNSAVTGPLAGLKVVGNCGFAGARHRQNRPRKKYFWGHSGFSQAIN
jgi:hypothetical protein